MMRGMSSPRRESDLMDMQALVDSIPALIHTGRPDGYLDYFNKRWLEYLGVTSDKVTGWNGRLSFTLRTSRGSRACCTY